MQSASSITEYKQQSRITLSLVGWALGAILAFLLAPSVAHAAAHFGLDMNEFSAQRSMQFGEVGCNVGRALAAVVFAGSGVVSNLIGWQHLRRIFIGQIAELRTSDTVEFLNDTQRPIFFVGIAGLCGFAAAYMVKQGVDLRHLYVFAVAVLGIGAMFLIGTIGYAILGPKVAKAKKKAGASRFPLKLLFLQAMGCATIILLFSLPLTWLLTSTHLL